MNIEMQTLDDYNNRKNLNVMMKQFNTPFKSMLIQDANSCCSTRDLHAYVLVIQYMSCPRVVLSTEILYYLIFDSMLVNCSMPRVNYWILRQHWYTAFCTHVHSKVQRQLYIFSSTRFLFFLPLVCCYGRKLKRCQTCRISKYVKYVN